MEFSGIDGWIQGMLGPAFSHTSQTPGPTLWIVKDRREIGRKLAVISIIGAISALIKDALIALPMLEPLRRYVRGWLQCLMIW